MNRLGMPATLLAVLALWFGSPATAQNASAALDRGSPTTTVAGTNAAPEIEVYVQNQEPPIGGGSGGSCSPNDQCCICKKACDDKRTEAGNVCAPMPGILKVICIFEANRAKTTCYTACQDGSCNDLVLP